MSTSNLVNYSRAGDQFHYLWAARRCLEMLSPQSALVAIAIEGVSMAEGSGQQGVKSGEDVIDVAEYYGSEQLAIARSVNYCQLKHSTVQLSQPWRLSELEGTLRGFAEKYSAAVSALSQKEVTQKLLFRFVTNRPISQRVKDVVDYARGQRPKCNKADYRNLQSHTGLSKDALKEFCGLLSLEDEHEGYWEQRNILFEDVSGYLAEVDADGPVRLKELVTHKAGPDGIGNPTITKQDVLRALNTNEGELFPAEMEIEKLESPIPREQEQDLVSEIIKSSNRPIIVHAESGVGKSIFASRLPSLLPEGSKCIVYDCFGNGQYRSPSRYRHRHKDALVQIANELSSQTLCHPLIPTPHADSSSYLKAFIFRLEQAIKLLRSNDSEAVLCIVIDAADNAQLAAEEIGEAKSFVLDLLREQLPTGVCLVMSCRTHRINLLKPPPNTLKLPLEPFTESETAMHLRSKFPDASEHDVAEFHRLSSQNPRVQASALALGISLQDMLRELGPSPTSVDDTLNQLLETAIDSIRDEAGESEKADLDRICQGFAVLRPLIPISVLSKISGASVAAIRSFVLDIGRPLKLIGDTIRFFDEPAETWFRETFRPNQEQFENFVATLSPLANDSAYVASTLPQLMLEAGKFDELVSLALSSDRLPSDSPIEKRDIELQRLHFALKASLRSNSYVSAAKLAQKAGGETAGNSRQEGLFQANTDLVGALLSADRIEDIVLRRPFSGDWMGCHHVYEAGLMSCIPELHGEARSRMRMAHGWLGNWSNLPSKQREKEKVHVEDIAELALAQLNVHGPNSCARSLRRWTPPDISYRAGRIVASRLIDKARYTDLDELAKAERCDLGLLLAIIVELSAVFRHPPKEAVHRALRLTTSSRVEFEQRHSFDRDESVLEAVTILAEVAHSLSVATDESIAAAIARYLPDNPPHTITSRYSQSGQQLIRAYTVRGVLTGKKVQLEDLASSEVRAELKEASTHQRSRELTEFYETVGRLLPWYHLRATAVLCRPNETDFRHALATATKDSSAAAQMTHWDQRVQTNQVAVVWLDCIVLGNCLDTDVFDEFCDWVDSLSPPLSTATYANFARTLARTKGQEDLALKYAKKAFTIADAERMDASAKIDSYVELSRALLPISEHDAGTYFDRAVEVASKIGDENIDRWTALIDLADCASSADSNEAELAYRLSRCAELTYEYVDRDKHFDWGATIRAISGLSPPSIFAILSRWRDRNFGWPRRHLPIAVKYLLGRGLVDPFAAASLVGIRSHWDFPSLLEEALSSDEPEELKEELVDSVLRYMELEGQDEGAWEDTKATLEKHQLSRHQMNERVDYYRKIPQAEDEADGGVSIDAPTEHKQDWSEIFRDVDTTSSGDLLEAEQRFRAGEPPFYYEEFVKEAIKRVKIGNEPKFIVALTDVPSFNLYDLRGLLEGVPESWRNRDAIEDAIADSIKKVCRRHCTNARRSRYYRTLPSTDACEAVGISEGELVAEVLEAIAESAERLDAGELFSLSGLLVVLLSDSEATDALSYGLSLVEFDLEETDGDGPWANSLCGPDSVEKAIAGYVWATLASPFTSLRWEGAHVVRCLVTHERTEILEYLRALAQLRTGGAFADAKLFFYELHAIQWLLIGLSRGAVDKPEMVAPYADMLREFAEPSECHVVIRTLASETLIRLADSSAINLTTVAPSNSWLDIFRHVFEHIIRKRCVNGTLFA